MKFFILITLFVFCSNIFANSDQEKTDTILKLTTAKRLLHAIEFDQLIQAELQNIKTLRELSPEVSDALFNKLFEKIDRQELENAVTGIIAKHYSIEEMNYLIEFYNTKIGRKFLKKGPIVTKEIQGSLSKIIIRWAKKTVKEL